MKPLTLPYLDGHVILLRVEQGLMAPSSARKEVPVERFGNRLLPLGGANRYKGVRGKQGRKRDKYQGCTPRKTHFTGLYDTALEAAVAFDDLKQDLKNGIDTAMVRQKRAKRGSLSLNGTHLCSRNAAAPSTDTLFCMLCVMRLCAAEPEDKPPTLSWFGTKSFSDEWPQIPPALDDSELDSAPSAPLTLPLTLPIVELGSSMRSVTTEDALWAAVGGAAVVQAQSCAAAPAAAHIEGSCVPAVPHV